MNSLLEEMYCKTFDFEDKGKARFEEGTELTRLLEINQNKLEENLNEEQKKRFQNYKDCLGELLDIESFLRESNALPYGVIYKFI